ncbi:galE [Symbiodinium sp. KB8]|nr:galE [Symbiodinium sp. KB8]
MDNLINASEKVVPRLQELTGKEIPLFKIDACDAAAVDKLFSEQKFDGIIHFAGLKVASSELLALSVSSSSPGKLRRPQCDALSAWIVTVTELGGTSTEVDVMEECNETEACQMPAPSVCKMVSGMPPFYEGCFSKLASWGNLGSASASIGPEFGDRGCRTSLSLEWSSGGDGDCIFQSWEAEWRPFGGSWMLAENETGTSEILTGLQENAAYEFRVRQLCTDSSLNSAYADFPESLLTLPGIFSAAAPARSTAEEGYGPSRCRVLKQCCGDQFTVPSTVCHSGEARKTVTLSRMDVMGGWGQPLWSAPSDIKLMLQCTAQSVADYTTFTEVQAPAPLWLQLHEATATTMKAKYRLGTGRSCYIIDETATCDCATLSLELRADDSDVWNFFPGQADLGCRELICFGLDVDTKHCKSIFPAIILVRYACSDVCQVTTYDSSFSYRQDQVARLGDRARPWGVTRTIRTTSESRAECVYFLPVFASD